MSETDNSFGEPGNEFTLSSNSGREEMKFALLHSIVADTDEACICSLTLKGRNWRELIGKYQWEIIDDCTVHLHQVLLSVSRLTELYHILMAWLRHPFVIEQELAMHEYLYFQFSLGPDAGIISSAEKPVARLAFAVGSLRGDFAFVVDQSCIRLFASGIGRAISIPQTLDDGGLAAYDKSV
jgi:hypothetical protein